VPGDNQQNEHSWSCHGSNDLLEASHSETLAESSKVS
jgi:hypothetical protein